MAVLERMREGESDGEWEDDVETAGDITITPEAVVKAGTLVGNNITLAGAMAGGSLRATR